MRIMRGMKTEITRWKRSEMTSIIFMDQVTTLELKTTIIDDRSEAAVQVNALVAQLLVEGVYPESNRCWS
jgi:hypothetical protein